MRDAARAGGGHALVLAGGLALGAFESGAFAALDDAQVAETLTCVAGCSIGAVTAAIIAGNAPEDRVERLTRFWKQISSDPMPATTLWFGPALPGVWRQTYNQASVVQTLMLGRPGLFQPRLSPGSRVGVIDVPALFDLAPLRTTLASLVDFDRLNSSTLRVVLAATDVLSGERVVFDTARGEVIGPEHVLASCALLPLFSPIQVGGRLLADGGLASNAPLDVVLRGPDGCGMRCFVVDLFERQGRRPHTLAASASRAGDLAFGNQSMRLADGILREHRLRGTIARLGSALPPERRQDPEISSLLSEGCDDPPEIVYVSYRAGLDEAGLGKPFDFSKATIADRWLAGKRQMQAALRELDTSGVHPADVYGAGRGSLAAVAG